ncbi:hypothetical protein ABDJ41_11035 [Pedobacter sp. ASV1-7]|uniref:M949_RS01915 family surface polysaccharide biosynthesis protein n=1 Tax=Pedobacter sp. ASV1-7 TaxID=3145237 RepID=UPI0032E86BDD
MKFKTLLAIILTLSVYSSGFAQNIDKSVKMPIKDIPESIKYEGKAKEAIRWTDKEGTHIVLATETGIYIDKNVKHESDGADAALYVYHYILNNDQPQLEWKIQDFIQDCPLDIEVSFVKNTLQTTDLNADGIPEIWVMYKTVCHGDISPSDLKIIMYQGKKKYAMRGTTKVQIAVSSYEGGEYKFDKAFSTAPEKFRQFAKSLWNKNITGK